ncbi:MAG: SpoIIE family protein phosphatase, partial [Armatimonadetes bacterium]|nr:SpoIIE family protein phosphatase [Armatimonadota bacterium]
THPAMVALRTAEEVRNIIMGVFKVEQNTYRWININAIPQFKPGEDKPYQVYTTFDDITERRRAEEVLRRYQLLSERARDIVLFIRRDGRIIEANGAAIEAYGYTHDELLTLSIQDLRAPNTRAITDRQMQQADTVGILFETVHMRKDGSIFPVEVSSRGADVEGDRVLLSIIRDISERIRFRQTLENQVAQLQRALLPAKPTIGGGYGIAAEYVPGFVGQEIGGDFYDVFETENGEIGILIGDVAGKGIRAAALAAATRSTVRAFAYDMPGPGEALTHTNSVLCARETEPDTFVTVLLAVLELRTGAIRYANAGHPPALIYRSSDGQVEHLEFGRPPVVAVEGENFDEHGCQLEPGDKIIFYTDGISEARRGREFFGTEGIERALRACGHLTPDEVVHRILHDAKGWSRGKLSDDVAIIVIQRPPALSPRSRNCPLPCLPRPKDSTHGSLKGQA